ncbi:hypothetical protein ETC04_16465 [Geobacillus sp. MR]|uniref:hypothetical protein n=1 Tax=Geobacillus sp. MR TaxID=2508875 RepID=UPI00148E5ECF|nr:hypothetical protein [Geobacillus sp. MR]NNU88677.1 hypothetical protein [Geobacillus sp. MR]
MYREMTTFKKRAEAIEKQIAELQEKKREAQEELAKLTQEHDGMIILEATEGVACDEKQLGKLKKSMKELEDKIADYQHRISVIEGKRKEVLAALFDDLEKGYVRELESLQREASAQFNDAIKLGFEYLLALQRVGKLKERASKLHAEFLNEGRKAVDGLDDKYRLGHSWINTTLFQYADNFAVGVSERAQRQALNGYVSPQVMLYELTGEIEGYHNRALDKLRKLKSE